MIFKSALAGLVLYFRIDASPYKQPKAPPKRIEHMDEAEIVGQKMYEQS
jgi:hypothetical protein